MNRLKKNFNLALSICRLAITYLTAAQLALFCVAVDGT